MARTNSQHHGSGDAMKNRIVDIFFAVVCGLSLTYFMGFYLWTTVAYFF